MYPASRLRSMARSIVARLLLVVLVINANTAHAEVVPKLPAEDVKGYTLTWQDEFTGDALNKAEWNLRTGERFASMNKAENVSVAGGMLRIALKKEPAGKLD